MHRTQWLPCLALAPFIAVWCAACPPARADENAGQSALGEIMVRAVDNEGSPQANVAVSLFSFDVDWRSLKNLDADLVSDSSGTARYDRLKTDETYVVRTKTRDGQVGYKQCTLLGKGARQDVAVTVLRPLAATIHVRDHAGKPVAGASIWKVKHTGPNGSLLLDSPSFQACGLSASPSNSGGDLMLPALPAGKIDLTVIHSDYVPCVLKQLAIAEGTVGEVILSGGIKLTVRIDRDAKQPAVDTLMVDLRHERFENPSTLIGHLPGLRPDGVAQFTVAAGKYSWLRLTHPDYLITPIYAEIYGKSLADASEPFTLQPGSDRFGFQLTSKVRVRGRVLDEASGKPMAGQTVQGEVHSPVKDGPLARFASEWTHADWGETNDKGEYEMKLAAGPVRVSYQGQGFLAGSEHYEFNVAPDGSTAAPDIVVNPLPKVRGVVRGENGQPLARAVVRFRGSILAYTSAVVTDEQGRFEISPSLMPVDFQTHERRPLQTLVAFDPYEPLGTQVQIRLDTPASLGHLVLRVKPQSYDSLITGFPEELDEWGRGIVPADQKDHLTAISLVGKAAPELDGAVWLNTGKPKMSLADFRGKYVLLQFWTTWCGPCHEDLPSVKLAHDLYKEKGFVVIGIHDNSMPIEDIKADVVKNELQYPIVVDYPDGRLLASYKEHGVSGYPSYVLLGPDGKVVRDDATVGGPSLRVYKVEIVRRLVMAENSQGR